MASFDDVHRRDLRAADGRLRLGEPWMVALREPLEFASLGPDAIAEDATVSFVCFVAEHGGRLKPASDRDRAIIADWKRRHRETPLEWFGLPDVCFGHQ